jgi:predicted dehydrogenase
LGKQFVTEAYTKKLGKPYDAVKVYHNYHELLANKEIDAVVISTPDHQHAIVAAAAVRAGKDVYLQKPASLTIAEGRYLSNAVQASGRILQIGSQQRSWKQFHRACELVRNGRIGEVKHVEVGLPGDPAGGDATPMPVPAGFDYDAWLGSTPDVPYTVDRVMPQKGFDRPGWLRTEQFGAGMITGWGAHHVDTAHWGMNTEYTGPVEIWGTAEFPKSGLWNVHGKFLTHARYANGMTMDISGEFPNGIKWYGTKGWIFVTRDEMTTPTAGAGTVAKIEPLMASDPKILDSVIGPDEIHLYTANEQHANWLDCVKTRKQPTAPVEIGHRACSTCLLHHIAMKTGRHLHWDPERERFKGDDEANAMLSRPQRSPYTFEQSSWA